MIAFERVESRNREQERSQETERRSEFRNENRLVVQSIPKLVNAAKRKVELKGEKKNSCA